MDEVVSLSETKTRQQVSQQAGQSTQDAAEATG